jgi:hypothetical protein
MDQRSLDAITAAASVLPGMPVVALSGVLLTARYCIDALVAQNGDPIVARDVARLVAAYGGNCSPENVRQILRALAAGGLPIESARSKGYWISPT